MRKPVFRASDQVRSHVVRKLGCISTEDGQMAEILDLGSSASVLSV